MAKQPVDQKLRRTIPRGKLGSGNLVSAGALIYCKTTQRYLFLLRNGARHDGSWGLPGGKITEGETVIEGLIREIKEELGGEINDAKIIPVEQFTNEANNFSFHTYVIPVDDEFVPELNHEHRGYCWVKLEDYPKPLHPGVWRSFNFGSVIEKLKTIETVSNQL